MTTSKPIKFDALEDAYNEDKIENGAWMQFSGVDGEPHFLTVGEGDKAVKYPVRACVRSVLSTTYEKHSDKLIEGAANQSRKLKSDAQRSVMLRKRMKENQPQAFAALVSKMDNISKQALGIIDVPHSDLLHFASQPKNKDWVRQVLEFADDNENYGGEGSAAVEEGKGGAADTPE